MRLVITGGKGLVGRALSKHCIDLGDDVIALDHATLDITNLHEVLGQLSELKPNAVFNCAAWTDVDGCEFNTEKAKSVNAAGPENLARASEKCGAAFLTISTDYVFDGLKDGFYTQRDTPNPISVYGESKLSGERRASQAYARTIVVRTGFIFGVGGKNFLSTVVSKAKRSEPVKAISDAWGTPTYAPHLAARLRELMIRDLPGVFHVVGSGNGASFEEFTREALGLAGCEQADFEAVRLDSLRRPAPRPRNSKLKCLLSEAIGLTPLPHWRDGLADFVRQPD